MLRGALRAHPEHPARGIEVATGDAPLQRSSDEVPGADWSGRDARNRLVFAQGGTLWARTGGDDVVLADFAAERPEPVPPPAWAMLPLDAQGTSSRHRRARRH